MKHKLVYDPVFRSEVLFYCCEDVIRVEKHLLKKRDVKGIEIKKSDAGKCWEVYHKKTGITFWIVYVHKDKDWKTMVHEAAHITFRILDSRLVKYGSENDETWCYLHEFFIKEFWHVMTN